MNNYVFKDREKAITDLVSVISRVNNVYRYSTQVLADRDTVPTHSFNMMLIAVKFMSIMKSNPDYDKLLYLFDKQEIIYKIFLHDIPEAYVGDIVNPTKYSSQKILDGIREAEKISINKVEQQLGLHEDNINGYESLEYDLECNPLVKYLVKMTDHYEMLIKIFREYKLGNMHIISDVYPQLSHVIMSHLDSINDYDTNIKYLDVFKRYVQEIKDTFYVPLVNMLNEKLDSEIKDRGLLNG